MNSYPRLSPGSAIAFAQNKGNRSIRSYLALKSAHQHRTSRIKFLFHVLLYSRRRDASPLWYLVHRRGKSLVCLMTCASHTFRSVAKGSEFPSKRMTRQRVTEADFITSLVLPLVISSFPFYGRYRRARETRDSTSSAFDVKRLQRLKVAAPTE